MSVLEDRYFVKFENGKYSNFPKLKTDEHLKIISRFSKNVIPDTMDDVVKFYIGIYYQSKAQWKEARSVYHQLKNNSYLKSDIYCELGNCYYQTGNQEKMLQCYLTSIEIGNSNALCDLGLWYQLSNQFAYMESVYSIAIEKQNKQAMFYMGMFCFEMDQLQKGRTFLEMAIKHGHRTAAKNLAIICKGMNLKADTIKYNKIGYQLGCEECLD
jgi:tetratricopeptide (TPR) repeat protein